VADPLPNRVRYRQYTGAHRQNTQVDTHTLAKIGGEMIGGRWRELGPLERYYLGTREILAAFANQKLDSTTL
jgi:hypothetical protein